MQKTAIFVYSVSSKHEKLMKNPFSINKGNVCAILRYYRLENIGVW